MVYKQVILTYFLGLLGGLLLVCAQEPEESAALFLEEYSDDFQENFFEGLKQKGIENYDRAIHLLLKCKSADENNAVVDYELATLYLETKEYFTAKSYAINAVNIDPDNIWYLNILVLILQKESKTLKDITSDIPYDYPKLKENLAQVYYQQNNYDYALEILKDLPKSSFVDQLTSNVNDAIANREEKSEKVSFSVKANDTGTTEVNPSRQLVFKIKGAIAVNNAFSAEKTALEAIENYPSQPYFYYAYGWALNKKGKNKEAIEVLEMGLDYLLGGNVKLANDFYRELAEAYNASHNPVKATIYLRKVIPGF